MLLADGGPASIQTDRIIAGPLAQKRARRGNSSEQRTAGPQDGTGRDFHLSGGEMQLSGKLQTRIKQHSFNTLQEKPLQEDVSLHIIQVLNSIDYHPGSC